MATLNERINDMLSRLEAAAASLDDSGQTPARPAKQASRYSYQQPASQQAEAEQGPGAFARSIEEAEKNASQRNAGQSSHDPLEGGVIPPVSARSMLQGVIYAEILGRPVSRRRGRGRRGF